MPNKIIRIIAVLFTIVAAATVLPRLYYTTFPSGIRSGHKNIYYSEILGDFIISEYVYSTDKKHATGQTVYYDRHGKSYSRDSVSQLLLLDNVSQLAYEGRFPDTICGMAVTPELVSSEAFSQYHSAQPGLYYGLCELRDQKTYTTRTLEPQDLFRITPKGIQFIICETNQIDEEKSRLFNNCLAASDFRFPALRMWTSPDKNVSEAIGYYVIDSQNKLYRLSMNQSAPIVRKLEKPDSKDIRNITFGKSPDIRAILNTEDGDMYIQHPDQSYTRLDLPNSLRKSARLTGNLFYRIFTFPDKNQQTTFVFDRNFRLIDSCTLYYPPQPHNTAGIFGEFLFPLRIGQTAWDGFYADWSPVKRFIWFNLVLTGITLFYKRRNGYRLSNPFTITDILFVTISGIYGFIGISAFPLKKSREEILNTQSPEL